MSTTSPPRAVADRARWATLAVCCTSLFLIGLDTTIVHLALPSIGDDLDGGTRSLAWVVDAYTLALASLLLSAGAIGDRFGRRRVFRIGLTAFGLASVACALAPSTATLVAARVAQGAGGAMLSPVALAIVVSVFPDARERARAIGVWAAMFGISMAIGPVLGGPLIDLLGWRAVFWVNVPVVAAVLALTMRFVPESGGEPRRLDLAGQLLFVGLVAGLVLVLLEAPRIGWDAPAVWAGGLALVATLAAFVLVESSRTAPLLELRAFRSPPFAAAVLGAAAVFVALSATLLLSTFYLQGERELTATAAGVTILPLAAGAALCPPWAGILMARHGPRRPLLLAAGGLSAGGVGLIVITTTADSSLVLMAATYLGVGIGFGFANAPITATAVSGLPPERAGVAGGITSTARQLGAALGTAAAGSLLAAGTFSPAAAFGWSSTMVAACGLVVLVVACASPTLQADDRRHARSRTRRSHG